MKVVKTALAVLFFLVALGFLIQAIRAPATAATSPAMGFALALVGGLLYFLPALVANYRHQANLKAIFALNLLLGWTLLGWIGALIWALIDSPAAAARA